MYVCMYIYLSVVDPSPSCPYVLRPAAHTSPGCFSIRLWKRPKDISIPPVGY